VRTPHRVARLKLPEGVVLDRSRFDAALTQAAVDAGATLLAEVSAAIEPHWEQDVRQVRLVNRDRRMVHVRARIVLACDGLGAPSARQLPGLAAEAAPTSRVGLGAVFPRGADDVPAHCICMAVGAGGYVGQARLHDGRVAMAAAVDPAQLHTAGPAATLRRILHECHAPPPPSGANLQVFGAPGLTRAPQRVASAGVLLVGDACGYVEPFTGEGMALALETAARAVPLAKEVVRRGWTTHDESAWSDVVRSVCGPRRTFCRGVSAVCRHPWMAEAAVTTAALAPSAVMAFARWMQRTPRSLRG
jgi:flavin-dependent dehydrogenase